MGKVYTDIAWANGNGEVEITMQQDVREVLRYCKERRESGARSHSDGLGQLECTLPVVIVRDAEEKGIDLHNATERRKYVRWLRDRYGWDFSTVVNTRSDPRIIIK